MNPSDAFERCLAALYEAALDDTRWPAAAALIEEAVGTGGSALSVGEGFDGDARITFSRYLERGQSREDLAREYASVYHLHDEALPRLRLLPHGQPVHVPDLYTEDELKTSLVYNEAFRRWRSHEGLYVRFDGPNGSRIVWTVANPVGGDGWQTARLRLFDRLLPHVHRSVLIRQALAAADALGSGLAGLLDNDRIGVVQLDRGGRVLAANGPALDLLRRGDGLTDRDGALDAVLPADRGNLQRLLGRALPDLWGAAPEGGSMTVERPLRQAQGRLSGRPPLSLHVSPVGDAAADFGGRRVAALVLVVDPARRPRIDAQRVAAALGLTASEARAAALLAEGRSVLEIADMTGWQASYVRRLLKRIYKKQGVSGQVSLVPRVLALEALPRD
ncbi:MAG: hypothetical protein OXH59_05565 [Rhodospirillaceae bacterium]|nr:hypothetical protein [Rhodospirillaceae bacterium]